VLKVKTKKQKQRALTTKQKKNHLHLELRSKCRSFCGSSSLGFKKALCIILLESKDFDETLAWQKRSSMPNTARWRSAGCGPRLNEFERTCWLEPETGQAADWLYTGDI